MRDIRVPASNDATDPNSPLTARPPRVPDDAAATLTAPVRNSLAWRVVDIVTAAILAVAGGLIFWGWNAAYEIPGNALDALLPGSTALVAGMWMLPGVLAALIIRKPGAAVLVELLAAIVSMALGAKWGWGTALSGLVQGLGAELVFLLFRYRKFTLPVAMFAGAAAGLFEFINELWTYGIIQKAPVYQITYLVCMVVSGALIAGGLSWLLTKALAATGALDRFAAGREARTAD